MGVLRHGELYLLLNQEEKLRRSLHEDPVVTLVDTILCRALELRASDVHIQPEFAQTRIRYRIDGVLHDHSIVQDRDRLSIVSRLKLLAQLDIAERRIPQDGKLSACFMSDNNEQGLVTIDFRIATFPSIYGEKLVVRILDRTAQVLDLAQLGLSLPCQARIKALLQLPYGFFLSTGPTGSGKTTTLYAMLSELNTKQKNIVTMEDPVEYDLAGITQSQVNAKAGFTFENGLRSLLRQDPDIIMIGEIRDTSTIQIAIEAALTGHMVLSTLHTNSAVGALTRIIDMGVEPFVLTASITAVLAQQLVRRLCDRCKQEVLLSSVEQQALAQYGSSVTSVFKPRGCAACDHIGYRGRVGLFELLVVDDVLRTLILKKMPLEVLHAAALEQGMVPLVHDGFKKMQQGIISFEELLTMVPIVGR